jgi:hypothetical protein
LVLRDDHAAGRQSLSHASIPAKIFTGVNELAASFSFVQLALRILLLGRNLALELIVVHGQKCLFIPCLFVQVMLLDLTIVLLLPMPGPLRPLIINHRPLKRLCQIDMALLETGLQLWLDFAAPLLANPTIIGPVGPI